MDPVKAPEAAPATSQQTPAQPTPAEPVESERDRVKAAIAAMQAEPAHEAPAAPAATPKEATAPAAPAAKTEPEAKPAEPPKETPDDMVAAAARERASIRETATKLKQREEELERQSAETRQMLEDLKKDPIAFMDSHAGPDWYMDATKRYLNKGAPSQEETIRRQNEELAELRQRVDQIQSGVSMQPYERQAEAYLNQLGAALSKPENAIISGDPDAIDKVHRYAVEHAQQTRTFLPIDELLGKVRSEQVERARKLSGFLQAEQPPPVPVTEQRGPTPQAGTISTRTQTPRAIPPVEGPEDDFDERARKRRAIAALTGGTTSGE